MHESYCDAAYHWQIRFRVTVSGAAVISMMSGFKFYVIISQDAQAGWNVRNGPTGNPSRRNINARCLDDFSHVLHHIQYIVASGHNSRRRKHYASRGSLPSTIAPRYGILLVAIGGFPRWTLLSRDSTGSVLVLPFSSVTQRC